MGTRLPRLINEITVRKMTCPITRKRGGKGLKCLAGSCPLWERAGWRYVGSGQLNPEGYCRLKG